MMSVKGSGFNDSLAEGWFKGYDENLKKFSKDEQDALEHYRDTSYTAINRIQRGDVPEAWMNNNKEKVKSLNSIADNVSLAITKSEIKQDISVFRGVDASKNEELAVFFNNLKVGDTYSDKGFSSTTLNKDIAHGKFSATNNKGANLTILIPKGSKALPLQNVGSEATKKMYSDEYEVLLDRNSQFEVIEKKGTSITVILRQ